MATNKTASKSAPKPTKSKAAPRAQPPVTSSSKHQPNASADKENVPPHSPRQEPHNGPLRPRQASALPAASHVDPAILAATLQRLEEMEARLAKEQKDKQELEAIIEVLRAEGKDGETAKDDLPDSKMIPRPTGTSGKDWSLQGKMGLAESKRKAAKYAALLRGLRDLVLNSNLKWELGWKEIPAAEKGKMFQVARERFPILRQYVNDWATEEIVKQYLKNKRSHHYSNGWLEVPERYAYLKQNASKRSATGSRTKRAKAELAASVAAKKSKLRKNSAVHHRKDAAGKGGVRVDDEDSEPPQEFDDEGDEGDEGGGGQSE